MGSPLSFPILCLANYSCWYSIYGKGHDVNEDPVLINGDDILFSSDPEDYHLWEMALSLYGFEKSVGKNYVDPRFFMINSELFDRKDESVLPYFRSGLLFGRHKASKAGSDNSRPPVITTLELCLRGSLNPTRTLQRFIFYHKKEIQFLTKKRKSLFLPVSSGGFGLKAFGAKVFSRKLQREIPAEENISLWQRKYSSYMEGQEVSRTDHTSLEDEDGNRPMQWRTTEKYLITSINPPEMVEKYNPSAEVFEDIISEDYPDWFYDQCLQNDDYSVSGPVGWRRTYGYQQRWVSHLSGSALRKVDSLQADPKPEEEELRAIRLSRSC